VCLWKWNYQLDRVVASLFVRSSGCCFRRGLIYPSVEVGDDIEWQDGEAKAVSESGLDLSAPELQSLREQEIDQPTLCWTVGAAKKACTGALAPLRAGVIGVLQGIGMDLGQTRGYCALRSSNRVQAVGFVLTGVRSPQILRAVM
jgi:hypothetical protein